MAGEAGKAVVYGLQHGGNLGELLLEVFLVFQLRSALVAAHQSNHAHAVRLASTVGKGSNGYVHGISTGVDTSHVGGGTETGGLVGVNPHRQVTGLLDSLGQSGCLCGGNQTGHVLDNDGIGTHVGNLLGQVGEVLEVVHGGGGVADSAVCLGTGFLGSLDGGTHVLRVVQAVEDAEDVHAVLGAQLHESFHHVISIVSVTHQVLAAQQHHVRGLGGQLLEGIQTIEGVLAEEAKTGVDGGATPGFQSGEAHGIKDGSDFEHLLGGHAGGCQRLVAVAQYGAVECCRFHILKIYYEKHVILWCNPITKQPFASSNYCKTQKKTQKNQLRTPQRTSQPPRTPAPLPCSHPCGMPPARDARIPCKTHGVRHRDG